MVSPILNRSPFFSVLRSLVVFVVITSFSVSSSAQTSGNTSGDGKTHGFGGPRRQLATIIFAGLGGAILGLSTLSFYGRPQEKLSNIAIGGAVGVMAGTAFVTYKAATNPAELYGQQPTTEHELDHTLTQSSMVKPSAPLGFRMAFEF